MRILTILTLLFVFSTGLSAQRLNLGQTPTGGEKTKEFWVAADLGLTSTNFKKWEPAALPQMESLLQRLYQPLVITPATDTTAADTILSNGFTMKQLVDSADFDKKFSKFQPLLTLGVTAKQGEASLQLGPSNYGSGLRYEFGVFATPRLYHYDDYRWVYARIGLILWGDSGLKPANFLAATVGNDGIRSDLLEIASTTPFDLPSGGLGLKFAPTAHWELNGVHLHLSAEFFLSLSGSPSGLKRNYTRFMIGATRPFD